MGVVDVEDWEQAGLYRPGSPGADERRALLTYLTERGATLAQMAEALAMGALPGLAGDLVLGPAIGIESVEEMASRCGLSVERVRRILLAAGFSIAANSGVPENLELLIRASDRAAGLMGEDAVLAFNRVLGAAATNIAEAAVALFYAEFGPGAEREGASELARAELSEAATEAFLGVPEIFSSLLLTQFRRATHRGLTGRGWPAPNGQADVRSPPGEPSEVIALGFVDLVGSTSWAEELSLREQSLALSRFETSAWSSAVLATGRVIKMIGDEVFFAAPSVEAACRIGLEVCEAAAADPVLPPARGAVGYGNVVPREGDYFGPLVNLVSRLVKVADPGGLVVTAAAADSLPTDQWSVRALAPQKLRGVERPVAVFAVDPRSSASG